MECLEYVENPLHDDCVSCGALQSLSLAALGPSRRPNAIADVAYNPVEIKARLVGVNVYTVANKKNEFVLVSGIAGVSCIPHDLCASLQRNPRGPCMGHVGQLSCKPTL
jgi:hypothetical protein